MSASENLDLWDNARLFGLLNIAMADGYTGSFDAKRFYNSWRPITVIRLAESDSPDRAHDHRWAARHLAIIARVGTGHDLAEIYALAFVASTAGLGFATSALVQQRTQSPGARPQRSSCSSDQRS